MVKSATRVFTISSLPPGKANISVISRNINGGSEIQGYFTTLFDTNNLQLATGFTPVTFTNLNVGMRYFVAVADFGEATFQQWSDGNTNRIREISSLSSNGITLTAMYSLATTPPPPPPPGNMGMTVFTYFGYGGLSSYPWNEIVAAKQAHPRVHIMVIVNPCNGTCYGGQATKDQVRELKQAGLTVLGYIFTGDCCGGTHFSAAHLINNINQAAADGVQGIFYDGAGGRNLTAAQLQDYRAAVAHARGIGLNVNIGNPGRCYTDLTDIFDINCIYEGPGRPLVSTVSGCGMPKAKRSVIPHDVGGSFNRTHVSNILDHCNYYYEITQFDAWHVPSAFPPWFGEIVELIDSKMG